MKALILAAGVGTRLKKYTKNLPKGMLSFMGKTIIERQIEAYRACGINDIIIVRGFEAEKINYNGIKYFTNLNYATTNMVESLMEAKSEFNDDIVVSYADIIFESALLKKIMSATSDFACAVDDNWKKYWNIRYGKIDFDTESLSINNENSIIEIGRENPSLDQIDARYIGLLKFSVTGLNIIEKVMDNAYEKFENKPWQQSGKVVRNAYMTDLLNAIISEGYSIEAVHYDNGWLEFDTNADYENAIKWANDGTIKELINI